MPYLACTHAHTYSEYTTNGSCHWRGPKREYHVQSYTTSGRATGSAQNVSTTSLKEPVGHLAEPALGGVRKEFHWVSNKLYEHNSTQGFVTMEKRDEAADKGC